MLNIGNGNGITLTYSITSSLDQASPILEYHFDEPASYWFFADTSMNEFHATCLDTHCPRTGETGAIGLAHDFDGVDDYSLVPANGPVDAIEEQDRLTIAAWVKIDGWHSGVFPIIDEYQGSGDFGWNFEINQPGSLVLHTSQTGQTSCATSLPLGTWQHVAVTYDRSKSHARFYVNGRESCNNIYNDDIPSLDAENLLVGYSPSGSNEYANGLIDELVIYDRALPASEVAALFRYPFILENDWLSFSPSSGSLPANTSLPVQVSANSNGLQPGSYFATMGINSNDPGEPVLFVPVTLTVTTPPGWGSSRAG